jgi:hypothetical protein
MANYIKKDKSNVIIIPDSTKLTAQDKADIALYREFGYTVKITRSKSTDKKPKAGYTKVEIIYYLEETAPDKVAGFTETAENKNYMSALRDFRNWYKETYKADYNGEAADLIAKNGKGAAARIKEIEAAEEAKKAAKKAAKKK